MVDLINKVGLQGNHDDMAVVLGASGGNRKKLSKATL